MWYIFRDRKYNMQYIAQYDKLCLEMAIRFLFYSYTINQ